MMTDYLKTEKHYKLSIIYVMRVNTIHINIACLFKSYL